jgi:hypothetical protein
MILHRQIEPGGRKMLVEIKEKFEVVLRVRHKLPIIDRQLDIAACPVFIIFFPIK